MRDAPPSDSSQPLPPSLRAGPGPLRAALAALGIRNRTTLLLILLLLVVAGLGAWTYVSVRHSLRDIREAGMQALLATQVEALNRWVEEKRADAAAWAARPEVRARAAELASLAGSPEGTPQALWNAPARTALLTALEPALRSEHVVAVNAVSPEGRIIATGFERDAGRLLAPAMQERLRDVFRGETRFIAPFPEGARVEGAEVVDPLTGTALDSYSIPGLTLSSASLDASGTKVTLQTSQQSPGAVYALNINGVKNLAGRPLTHSTSFTAWGIGRG